MLSLKKSAIIYLQGGAILDKHYTFSIQQVSELTGLSKQVIRKWEDRYAIIQPKRLENGYRAYSQSEIDLLNKTVAFVDQGYAIKQAAALANEAIHQESLNIQSLPKSEFDHYIKQLEDFGAIGDDVQLIRTLQQVHLTYGIESCLQNVVIPFLKRIGDLWCDQTWGEFQEAISSSTVRDFLAGLRRTITVPSNAPVIVGSCLPFERHENPMHILLLRCMLKGYRTIMLGAAPAPTAIQSTVLMTNPNYVLLTGSTDVILNNGSEAILALDKFASEHPTTKFFVGGAAIEQAWPQLALQHMHLAQSIDDIFA